MEKFDPHQSLTLEALQKYGTDSTKMAMENKLDPVIGRQQQIERVIQILCMRRKNNPCLIGDPGVGKSVVVEGLAQLIATASVPPKLQDKKIFSIEMGRLIAGASYRGEFEERLIKIVDEVKHSEGAVALFIDEVHTLIGAGGGNQALDASNILKPALARGELKCIGATTQEEYKKYIEKDPALQRRFQRVEVPEPSVDETVQILKGLSTKYESHHTVRFTDKALIAAASLSKQYICGRFLPDKAIDLIDEAGARAGLGQPRGLNGSPVLITEIDIEKVVSLMIGTDVYTDESKRYIHMEAKLQKSIVGQDRAVKAVSLAVRRASAGIRDSNRPISSFLFTGPTGVGKTELAKVLAAEYFGYKEAIVRLDMSQYMERHSVAKLLGSPPGYIGHEDGGHLTEAVRRRPHCVVLFDEVEKAHGDIFNTMLQIMDDGRLTDSKGRTVDFRNAIIIMTSNIGGESSGEAGKVSKEMAEKLEKHFKTEFLNRLDDVIVFKKIGYSEMKEILEIMLKNLYGRVKAKNVNLEVTLALKNKLVLEGYNPLYGARPLKRAITRLLEDTLAEKMLSGDVKEGDTITMDVDSDGDVILCC